jgi:ATPase subunit of ABC transporter with duplicated ATPase domains
VPVLFISHDETLIENTANTIIHLELVRRKTHPRATVSRIPYAGYVKQREQGIARQSQQAKKEKEEHDAKMDRFRRIQQSVDHAGRNVSKAERDTAARLLKKKMHALKINDVVLAKNINLRVTGSEKVCITGKNGAGKTSLLRKIASELLARKDIYAAYMPQNYNELLDYSDTPVDFLAPSGLKTDITSARTYLGSVKFTADEMGRKIGLLSGGQQAKLFLLKMILDGADVLILDEPTRNFSPLSNPVLRGVLKEFGGVIISVSHDRKYINEVCGRVYTLTEQGLVQR